MGSRGILLLKLAPSRRYILNKNRINNISSSKLFIQHCTFSSLQPSELPRLAKNYSNFSNPSRVEEFPPKIRQFECLILEDVNSGSELFCKVFKIFTEGSETLTEGSELFTEGSETFIKGFKTFTKGSEPFVITFRAF
ncbi:hypothetical protein Ddye_007940 [Dipteronia dyeriana]|uniref:Uncharacterized protein n=1 Tax=Dipteronia dyeriana TaxID=168575 RepID=A0AAE0CS43_9ROSI|nr:hypothetical protein Ddye_007940 [Dipteronia dyeriana]